ncbi:hypothetical protein M1373_03900 [Candidatus Marsarchaeota archaeon]|nr:hypothetical protein [Candidatus Marsarchaeota archaeon]
MAVDLSKLIVRNKISPKQLSGKIIAIDAYNVLYQFLSIIRQPDGTPLTNSEGKVTSHLSGLFYRSIDLLENNITPIYQYNANICIRWDTLKIKDEDHRGAGQKARSGLFGLAGGKATWRD